MERQKIQLSDESEMVSIPTSNEKQDYSLPEFESSGIKEIDEGLYWPLSGKPFVDMIITKTAVKPYYNMYLPRKMGKELPPDGAHAVLTYGRKKWDMFYGGTNSNGRFSLEWRKFADDNNLKAGDGLVFELSEYSSNKVHFKVMILRGDFPSKLLPEDEGESHANPILIYN